MTDKAPTGFPYAWTEEAGLPRYQRVRAEGLPLGRAIWSGLGYLRKYRKGKRSAPPEEVAYFDEQRRLLSRLPPGPEEGARLALVGDLMWLRDGWNDFLAPLIFLLKEDLYTLAIGLTFFKSMTDRDIQFNLMMAASVMVVLPVVVLFLFFQRYFIQGMTVGSVKG